MVVSSVRLMVEPVSRLYDISGFLSLMPLNSSSLKDERTLDLTSFTNDQIDDETV